MDRGDKGGGEPRQPLKASLVKEASKRPPVPSRYPAATTAPGPQGVGRGRGRGRSKQQEQLPPADKTWVPPGAGGGSKEELDGSTIVDRYVKENS